MDMQTRIEIMCYVALFVAGLILVLEVNKRKPSTLVRIISVPVIGISAAGLATAFAMVI